MINNRFIIIAVYLPYSKQKTFPSFYKLLHMPLIDYAVGFSRSFTLMDFTYQLSENSYKNDIFKCNNCFLVL